MSDETRRTLAALAAALIVAPMAYLSVVWTGATPLHWVLQGLVICTMIVGVPYAWYAVFQRLETALGG